MHENAVALAARTQEAVVTGSRVRLLVLDEEGEWEVTIVSSDAADPDAARISAECPIGEALLGRRVGDEIAVDVPSGRVQFRIISVSGPGSLSGFQSSLPGPGRGRRRARAA